MRRGCLAIIVAVAALVPAYADDREKAEKQMRMITAMSRDNIARSLINHTFAEVFKVERKQLIAERKSMGLSYGNLFLMHELISSGTSMQQIADGIHAHRTLVEIAEASKPNWKNVASEAKKMNNRINDCIYKHFLHGEADTERDKLDHYNPVADFIRADLDATSEEIAKAQTEYIFWRHLAAPKSGGEANLNDPVARDYKQARDDIGVTHGNSSPGSPSR
jgi:hypothetical protein